MAHLHIAPETAEKIISSLRTTTKEQCRYSYTYGDGTACALKVIADELSLETYQLRHGVLGTELAEAVEKANDAGATFHEIADALEEGLL